MSPAARRYAVRFTAWTEYEAVVLADNQREALAKGRALLDDFGPDAFRGGPVEADEWVADPLGEEAGS